MEFTIKIAAPELAHAILELANILAMTVSSEAAKFEMAAASQGGTAAQAVTVAQPTPNVMPVQTQAQATFAPPIGADEDLSGSVPTVVELRAKAQEKGKTVEGKKAVKALLEKYGSKSISDVSEDQRVAFMAALEDL